MEGKHFGGTLKRKDVSFLNDVISLWFSSPTVSFAIQQGAFDGSCKGPIELQKKREYFRQLFSDAADGKEEHGLKLGKTWPLCSSLNMAPCSSL